MLEQDVIEEVNKPSHWVSNLVIVPKKSGDLMVCCDLREVNHAVVRERYVLPKVDDTLHALRGSKYFAKVDAKSGFFQLPLAEESRYITMFITPRGCYRFKRTPFRPSDATARKIAFTAHQMFGERFCKGHLCTLLMIFDVHQRSCLVASLPPRSKAVKAVFTHL